MSFGPNLKILLAILSQVVFLFSFQTHNILINMDIRNKQEEEEDPFAKKGECGWEASELNIFMAK